MTREPIKVLHLTISFAPGGRRSAILTLIANLVRLGIACELGCLKSLGCSVEESRTFPAPVTLFDRRGVAETRAIEQLASFCEEHGVNVVHAHDAESQLVGALLKQRGAKIVLVKTFHRTLSIDSATIRDRVRNAFASTFCSAIITGSKERQQHYLKRNFVSRDKMIRIPFGVEVDRFHPDAASGIAMRQELGVAPNMLLIGAAGHFGEEKGIDVAIRSFQELCRTRDPASIALFICGDGKPKQVAVLSELAARTPHAKIFFTGFRHDLDRWYRAMDVFLHMPRAEAFGLVLIEALATGIPVVATHVGGIPEIIKDQKTGFLIPSGAPEHAAKALNTLLDDPELRAKVGAAGRESVLNEFSATLYAGRHLRLYEALLAGYPPRIAFPGADL